MQIRNPPCPLPAKTKDHRPARRQQLTSCSTHTISWPPIRFLYSCPVCSPFPPGSWPSTFQPLLSTQSRAGPAALSNARLRSQCLVTSPPFRPGCWKIREFAHAKEASMRHGGMRRKDVAEAAGELGEGPSHPSFFSPSSF